MSELSERLVDGLHATYGAHPRSRAAHAKGVLCSGTFTPTPAASTLTTAVHLAGQQVRAHVRFSNGSGNPSAPDNSRDARGMAVKFYLPEAGTTDIVAITLPVFFVRTPADLLAFNEARRPDPGTGQPDLAKVGTFLGEHPEAVAAVTAAMTHPIPASYVTLTYHALHAFGFVAADGAVRFGRYHWIPEAGEQALDDDEAAAQRPDYLREELSGRLAKAPAAFQLDLQLPETTTVSTTPRSRGRTTGRRSGSAVSR